MYSKRVVIENKLGLHSRPAVMFVDTASKFSSKITIEKGDKVVVAKSIMNMLALGLVYGSEIIISAEGEDEEAAVNELEALVKSKFGEN